MALILPLGAGMTYVGAVLARVVPASLPTVRDSDVVHAVGWIAMLFFGGCTAVIAMRFVRGGLAYRIDSHGICDGRWTSTPTPWTAIDGFREVAIRGHRMLGYDIADAYVRQLPWFRRYLAALNRYLCGFSSALSALGTDRSLDEIVDAVRIFAPDKFAD
jgi:hypothetical protein